MYLFVISDRLIYWPAVAGMNCSTEWMIESFTQLLHSKTPFKSNEIPLFVAVPLFGTIFNAKIE